ncbi:MAG: hypothetical protein KDD03_02620 [Gelidibacter sp.]|nr:hypothetical protein [Gelidibacter sp.]
MIFIGIDPGVKTGYAVWCTDQKKLVEVKTIGITMAMDLVRYERDMRGDLLVIVEDARKRKYFKGENINAKAQGAGSVKRDCSIWEEFLKSLGIGYVMRAPRNTKTSEQYFKKMTRWTGRTSSHARDAALLVVGMKAQNNLLIKN